MNTPSSSKRFRQAGTVSNQIISPVLFTLSILLSTGLLFMIQPLLSRSVAPVLGGSVTTWSLAIFFFQVVIIVGYLYTHLLTKLPRIRHQIGIHIILWLCAMGFMPVTSTIGDGSDLSQYGDIEVNILMHLTATAGLPVVFLAANAPLIQTWYGRTRGPSSQDPYFLYGASNLGALIALVSYPLIAEPIFGIARLALIWSVLFASLGALLFISALSTTRDHPDAKTVSKIENRSSDLRMIWVWAAISFVPSALMLSVTTKLSMDFGSTPIVWVIPLGLYLITFLAGFQSKPMLSDKAMVFVYPSAIFVISLIGITQPFDTTAPWATLALLLSFTMISLHLNRRLYSLRPDTSRLTVFYLTIAIGGAFGGAFNAIVAPTLMKGFYELPLIILAAAALPLLKNKPDTDQTPKWIGLFLVITLFMSLTFDISKLENLAKPVDMSILIGFGALAMIRHRIRIMGICLICFAAIFSLRYNDRMEFSTYASRNYFGINRITETEGLRTYISGSRIAGAEFKRRPGMPPEPLFQYHRSGPLGQMATSHAWDNAERIGIVGLGVGSMLSYRHEWQHIRIYELNPEVIKIAMDPARFTFFEAYGQNIELVTGDPRTALSKERSNQFDIFVVDAMTTDELRAQLLTVEAIREYVDHLAPDGFIVINTTSTHFRLDRPVAAAADTLGLEVYALETGQGSAADSPVGAPASALVISKPGHRPLFTSRGWLRVDASYVHPMTDDSLDVLPLLKNFNRPF